MSQPGAAAAAASGAAGVSSTDRQGDLPALRSPRTSPGGRLTPSSLAQQSAPSAVGAPAAPASPLTRSLGCKPSFDMSNRRRTARAAAVGVTSYSLCRREPQEGDCRSLLSALTEADDGEGNVVSLPDILR